MGEKNNRDPEKTVRITRREFARSTIAAAASVAMLPTKLLAQSDRPAPAAAQVQLPEGQRHALSAEGRAEVEAKMQAIIRKYGKRLSEAEKADVRRLLGVGQKSLETLRAYPLHNGDAPATVFNLFPDPFPAHRAADRPRPAR